MWLIHDAPKTAIEQLGKKGFKVVKIKGKEEYTIVGPYITFQSNIKNKLAAYTLKKLTKSVS